MFIVTPSNFEVEERELIHTTRLFCIAPLRPRVDTIIVQTPNKLRIRGTPRQLRGVHLKISGSDR